MKAIVFDMDGVLFDTERICMESWVRVADRWGVQDMEQVFPQCLGRNTADSNEIILERYGRDFPYEDFRLEAGAEFWKIIEEQGQIKKKGVDQLLSYLREGGWKIGLASSTGREAIMRHLKSTGLEDYFTIVISGDQITHSKPEPEIYLLACKELGADPDETYAIEDSYNGIRSAYRAGMRPIMVPDLLPPTEEMRELSYAILNDLIQVKAYFEENVTE